MAKYLDLVGLSIFFGKLKPLYLSDISYANDKLTLTKGDGSTVSVSLASSITVDDTLSNTSSNPVQNKVIKEALDGKLGKNETAAAATQDGAGNTISTTYASKVDVSALLSTKLGVTATAYAATRDGAGNNIVDTYAKKTDISGIVKSVNGKEPDADGNVNVANMRGANDLAPGKAGLVPAPAAGMQNKFLCSDATWKDAGGLPVGHEFFTTNPNIPAGCIPLLGGEYSRTAYADLWAWVQTQEGYLIGESVWQSKAAANGGNVPFYSKGDGSTTFRVPALKCWVKGANSISEIGGYLAAGLPNITGSTAWAVNGTLGIYSVQDTPYHQNTGALSVKTDGKAYGAIGATGEDSAKSNVSVNIDASLSNPIYGSSDTVQPSSIVGMWLVKAYGIVTNVGSTDVANIAQGLTELETRVVPIEKGGTGATTASDALISLGIFNSDGHLVLPDGSEFWIA